MWLAYVSGIDLATLFYCLLAGLLWVGVCELRDVGLLLYDVCEMSLSRVKIFYLK